MFAFSMASIQNYNCNEKRKTDTLGRINSQVRVWRPNVNLILILDEALGGLEVCLNHLLDERVEVDLTLPPEKALGLGGVTQQ